MNITIGSRGSDLALWQAHFVKRQLEEQGHSVSIEIIVTKGDRIQDLSFDKIEGKGFFTKEIEDALLNGKIDLAVHSHKDLETTSPEGLTIGAVSYRENPTDSLIIRKDVADSSSKFKLSETAVVGTSSARRQTQLKRLMPQLEIKDLRGNVPTRIQKLRDGQYDAIVLATAGLKRLEMDLSEFEWIELEPNDFVPAPAQGVLGLQIRSNDTELAEALKAIHHQDVANCIEVERSILRLLDGGCQLPLGAYCYFKDDQWTVYTAFAPSKNDIAELSFYQSNSSDQLAEEIVAHLTHAK